jgi:branched-chain amino acid aminotransferase
MKITKIGKSRLSEVDLNTVQFGKTISDHMAICHYKDGAWQEPEIMPFANLSLSPAISALHYGQAVFEGMSAYKNLANKDTSPEPSSEAVLFRIRDHAKRLSLSLKRLMMPEMPIELFESCLTELIKLDKNWIPENPGSYLYIRPFVFATDEYVGVKPSSGYTFIIFSAPTGPYYSKKLKVKVEQAYTRATPGGVGAAKAAGNYAASMLATAEAQKAGFDQIIWTDSKEHAYIEESGTMNVFCVIDGIVITPKTTDTILSGLTRGSICTICKELNIPIEERPVSVEELRGAMKNGTLQGMFGTGTAVTLIEFESVTIDDFTYTLPDLSKTPDGKGGFIGEFYKPAFDRLRAIKTGADNAYSWTTKI